MKKQIKSISEALKNLSQKSDMDIQINASHTGENIHIEITMNTPEKEVKKIGFGEGDK